jgi:hypothetical protein
MAKIFTNETCAIATIYLFVDRHPEKSAATMEFARANCEFNARKKQPNWQPTFKGGDSFERRLYGTFERPMVEVVKRMLERAPRSDYGDKRIVIGTHTGSSWGKTQYGIHNEGQTLFFYTSNAAFNQHCQPPRDAFELFRPWVSGPQYEWELRALIETQLEELVTEYTLA